MGRLYQVANRIALDEYGVELRQIEDEDIWQYIQQKARKERGYSSDPRKNISLSNVYLRRNHGRSKGKATVAVSKKPACGCFQNPGGG